MFAKIDPRTIVDLQEVLKIEICEDEDGEEKPRFHLNVQCKHRVDTPHGLNRPLIIKSSYFEEERAALFYLDDCQDKMNRLRLGDNFHNGV